MEITDAILKLCMENILVPARTRKKNDLKIIFYQDEAVRVWILPRTSVGLFKYENRVPTASLR